jgi:hypothetical protein
MSVSNIILNSSNIVNLNQGNNQLVFKFPSSVKLSNHALAVSSISMFYSWFNISTALGNNTFSYTWSNGTTTTTYPVTIPDGIWEISDINGYLQNVMISNGHYSTDTSGNFIYYLEMVINPVEYGVQLNSFVVLATAPAGITYQFPTPTQNFNPQFIIPAKFNSIIGFSPNTTLPVTTYIGNDNLSFLSTQSPEVQPNPVIYLTSTGINNPYIIPNSIIYSISPNVAVGEQISEKPPQLIFNKILEGTYDRFTFSLLGTDFAPINIKDSNMTFVLEIRNLKTDADLIQQTLLGSK